MKLLTPVVALGGAIALALVFLAPSRPKVLAPSRETESASTYSAKDELSPSRPPSSPAAAQEPAQAQPAPNLLTRLYRGEEMPLLRLEQVEPYLAANHRAVESLLGAYRTTRDKSLLQEAAEKFPNDPRVAFEEAYFGAQEDRRKWLDTFKASAPDNALANYLSANDYFKAGDKSAALEELQAGAAKSNFQDYFGDFVQNATEAYRAAGYSEAEAKTAAASSALLPQLATLKQVGLSLVDVAQSSRAAGDDASARTAVDMAMALGARLNQQDSPTLIQTLVGIAVEKNALGALDPASPYGADGQSVQATLDALIQQREALKTLTKSLNEDLITRVSEADLISYRDRQLLFGAQPAIQWLINKYPPSTAPGP